MEATMPTRYPLSIQYLGVRGNTRECVHAMVNILTSPYPCKEITIVVERRRGKDHEAVCFVIWGWLGQDVTIVPDGFGTHGGTGGWGLGLVLELIEFYRATLKEQWVEPEMFERIAGGRPTNQDIADLQQMDITTSSWPFWKSLFRSRLTGPSRTWSAFDGAWAKQFPFWLLELELLDEVRDVERDPASAVFRVVKRLEIIIRTAGAFDADLVGLDLISKAMGKDGPFVLKAATGGEKQGWDMLFRGVIGAFKNPQSHRDEELTLQDAAGRILAVNALLSKLKQDFPDQFARQGTNNLDNEDVESDVE